MAAELTSSPNRLPTLGTDTTADPVLAAVAALPLPADDQTRRWHLRSLTAAWLASARSDHTRRARFADLSEFLTWCQRTDLDPRHARRADVDVYARTLLYLGEASRARRLSNLSSWFSYLVSNDVLQGNPVKAVPRPKVSRNSSPTVALTGKEAGQFMRAARRQGGKTAARNAALLGILAELGLRVSEALDLDFVDFRHNLGHRTVRLTGKGQQVRELPIPAPLGRDLDRYFTERAAAGETGVDQLSGPVFVTATGKRMDQPSVFRLVRRVATDAGLPNADRLGVHSLRHTLITALLDAGAPLADVQDVAGHADSRTTRGYDHGRGSLDRSPLYRIAGLFSEED